MSLAQTQTLMARLFTDGKLRRAFFDAPIDVARSFGLSEAEAIAFAAIDRREVEAFAQSLYGKRALDLRKAMPFTAQALEEQFESVLFPAISDISAASVGADARALLRTLEDAPVNSGCAGYIADLARFELAFIEAGGAGIQIRRFNHDIAPIVSALRSREPVSATRRAMIGVWIRLPGARLRWRLFALPGFYARR